MSKVTIVTNSAGSADYYYIYYQDKLVDEGHNLQIKNLSTILEFIQGYTSVEYLELTDLEFHNWTLQ